MMKSDNSDILIQFFFTYSPWLNYDYNDKNVHHGNFITKTLWKLN